MCTIDLNLGFGNHPNFRLFKFPDNSIKFEILDLHQSYTDSSYVNISLKNNEDLITLMLVKSTLDQRFPKRPKILFINYLMYQQDDRINNFDESFGLKVISGFINSMNWDNVNIFHPHSDVTAALINNCTIITNKNFVQDSIQKINGGVNDSVWVIPDSGAFKTQFKLIEKMNYPHFLICNKSRDPITGKITTVVEKRDIRDIECFIVDDICLKGTTFINIAKELKKMGCSRISLVVSHGVFNEGVKHLYEYFSSIYTTNSICSLPSTDKLNIYTV